MPSKPLFSGLVFDENDQLVDITFVGQEPCYVVDDEGFNRHIPSEQVDRQVLNKMHEFIEGHEEIISEQAIKMLGQDDIFTRAIFLEESKTYMGMTGFKVIINHHGEVIEVKQPGLIADDE